MALSDYMWINGGLKMIAVNHFVIESLLHCWVITTFVRA
jgi:hypothetical protein